MRLGAIVVDLAVIGPTWREWLERLCGALPELGVVVCTGSSTVAQRVRGLRLGADDWLTKPCHPEELIARVESVVRRRRRLEGSSRGRAGARRRGRDPPRPVPGVRARREHRPDAPRVRADRAARLLGRARARARVHLPAAVGLRDGARRPLGRRVRAQAAPEARARLARLALHPHPLRHRLPLRRRAGRRPDRPRAAGAARRCSTQSPATSSISRGRSSASSVAAGDRREPALLHLDRAPRSAPRRARERSGSWPTSSSAPPGAAAREQLVRVAARRSRRRAARATTGSTPSSAQASRAVSRARTRGLAKTCSKRTPRRASARPAARAWRSPRAVSRRSKSSRGARAARRRRDAAARAVLATRASL